MYVNKYAVTLVFIMSLLFISPITISAQFLSVGNRTIVSGKVINRNNKSPQVISIIFCDPIRNNARKSVRLDTQGNFRAEYDMILAHTMTLNYGVFADLYAAPGDSIYLTIDASKLDRDRNNAICFAGARATFNRDYYRAMPTVYAAVNDIRFDVNQPFKPFIKHFKEVADSLQKIVLPSVPHSVKSTIKEEIVYALANLIMNYRQPGVDRVMTDNIFAMNELSILHSYMGMVHIIKYYSFCS